MKTEKMFLCTIDEEDGELVTLRMAPVDLCALLALADEMDEVAQRRRSMGYEGFALGDEDRASRIREACGMVDAG